jgi:hypothetical protein
VDVEDDRYFRYEPEVLQEDYAKEIDALDPKTFSDRPPHPTQEGWIDDYYSKWIQSDPAGRELQATKSQKYSIQGLLHGTCTRALTFS